MSDKINQNLPEMRITPKDVLAFIKKTPKRAWIITITVYVTIFSIGFLLLRSRADAVSGDITSDTTWSASADLTGNVNVKSGATLTIDPGVTITSTGNYTITVESGGVLDVNGTDGSHAILKHKTATSAGSWSGVRVLAGGSASFDYTEVLHANVGIRAEGGTVVVNDCLINTNHTGVAVFKNGQLTTARNTFDKNTYFAVEIDPDVNTATLGSGADVDTLGTNAPLGYKAIGIGYASTSSTACPSDVCELTQREFLGISNIPYVVYTTHSISNDTLRIAAGVTVKFRIGARFDISDGTALLDINGTALSPAQFTSERDDTLPTHLSADERDTNRDSNATSPAAGNWKGFNIHSSNSTPSTIDYGKFYYAEGAVRVVDNSTAATIQDCTFDTNQTGIVARSKVTIATARNYFYRNTLAPIFINPEVTTADLGQDADQDTIGEVIGVDANGYSAVGVSFG